MKRLFKLFLFFVILSGLTGCKFINVNIYKYISEEQTSQYTEVFNRILQDEGGSYKPLEVSYISPYDGSRYTECGFLDSCIAHMTPVNIKYKGKLVPGLKRGKAVLVPVLVSGEKDTNGFFRINAIQFEQVLPSLSKRSNSVRNRVIFYRDDEPGFRFFQGGLPLPSRPNASRFSDMNRVYSDALFKAADQIQENL